MSKNPPPDSQQNLMSSKDDYVHTPSGYNSEIFAESADFALDLPHLASTSSSNNIHLKTSNPNSSRSESGESSSSINDHSNNSNNRTRTPLSNGSTDFDLSRSLNLGVSEDGRYFHYAPSSESLLARLENRKTLRSTSGSNTASRSLSWSNSLNPNTCQLPSQEFELSDPANDPPFPAWCLENSASISSEAIYGYFVKLKDVLGFQLDNMENSYENLMVMLDSRASRMSAPMALTTLHADYIGGTYANYRKWIFCTGLYNDDFQPLDVVDPDDDERSNEKSAKVKRSTKLNQRWRRRMAKLSPEKKVIQVALYLLVWGEGLTLRYTPECLCFIYKLSYDYFTSVLSTPNPPPLIPEGGFLNQIVKPLYNFVRDQSYQVINGKYFKREKDHSDTIGYDDVNELFWSRQSLDRIVLPNKTKLMDLPMEERFLKLGEVNWKKAFQKTYYERRTILHLLTNFNRIWVFHFVVFYFYLVSNANFLYDRYTEDPTDPDPRDIPMKLSITASGGGLGCLITIISSLCELSFLPYSRPTTSKILFRIACLFVLLSVCVGPYFYLRLINRTNAIAYTLAIVQLAVAVVTTAVLIIVPSASLFVYSGKKEENGGNASLTNRSFTANFPKLEWKDRAISIGLWFLIFLCKLVESYFYITLSFKDPFKAMANVDTSDCRDQLLGKILCQRMGYITLAVMTLLDLVLFFLDTYFWYVVWNSFFSIAHSFYIGISILTPWRNIFSRLPKRIHAKVLATGDMDIKYKPKFLTSQIWNSIVISMYRDHLLSIDHLQRLLYQQAPSEQEGKRTLKPPTFFVAQEDQSISAEFFPPNSEAERRISFFAQSLSTVLPEPVAIDRMPSFTVFTPHYSEKILLSLREIIREDNRNTRVTLLEYLKSLHGFEWANFVKDTKVLEEENAVFTEDEPPPSLDSVSERSDEKSEIDDLPLYAIGFKSASPEYILRTRIWASLRAQTLYRTISGFMNYARAIKTLYRVENPDMVKMYSTQPIMLDQKIENMVKRKFRFLISMQRYSSFNQQEKEDVEFLLKVYPNLQIAYIQDKLEETEQGPALKHFSCLIDGTCERNDNGTIRPKFSIELPGHPILGDGKSDNQNHSVIFTRGEYLQLVDANQDNYLEECMKVRNILAEFEQFDIDPTISPYSSQASLHFKPPVAIVGAREYIFSENIGVLGDVAAGKEQTFGTMTQRIMAKVGGKLHYGHPDFLNTVFMTTRGGVSKAQKGLHLNEDIYAGMTAFQRGGRIKHTEYYQCGKGRDLGFSSVLAFNTKIGTGMGEQMLSREQYYLGTQLPLDRFLTFYYAHPGFHVNNILIMIATYLIMVSLLCIGSLYATFDPELICELQKDPEALPKPEGCFNIYPIRSWVSSTIISIFIVFAISYLPLFLQVFSEQGFTRTLARLGKHFMSFSPIFEIFVNQIYASSLLNNLSYGGAHYIATGRGFATTRLPFSSLYSQFASSSIYSGIRILTMILFASIFFWIPFYIYFWIVAISLCIAPFLFNPHQFSSVDFILDYRQFLIWLSSGNTNSSNDKNKKNSWVAHCRLLRTQITGFKRHKLGQVESSTHHSPPPRAHKLVILFPQLIFPVLTAALFVIIYAYLGATSGRRNGILRALLAGFAPVALNAVMLLILFPISLLLGPLFSMCFKKFGAVIAAIAHTWAVLNIIVIFLLVLALEKYNFGFALLAMITATFLQQALFQIILVLVTREILNESTNQAWWTGVWHGRDLGLHAVSQPLREFFCKLIELSLFATDFILGHVILLLLFPFTLIPLIDRWHSVMLFWLRPDQLITKHIYSIKQLKQRRSRYIRYLLLFLVVQVVIVAIIVVPIILGPKLPFNLASISFVKSYLI